MNEKIILLDLNYTLVSNQLKTRMLHPIEVRLRAEEYRRDLIKAIAENYVIIITARPSYQGDKSIENIKTKTGWEPNESYFNDLNFDPPTIKESILNRFVFPKHGKDGSKYLAIESNPKTRDMYRRHGIHAEPYEVFIKRFPDLLIEENCKEVQLSLFNKECYE